MTSQEKTSRAVWIIVVIAIIIIAIYERSKVLRRTKNSNFMIGEVIKIDEGSKGSKYVVYRYTVESKQYTSSVSVKFCKECKYECCKSGARVTVRYEVNNPSNSNLVH
jgi:hypothetical protein